MKEQPTLTVAALIELLLAMPPEAKVRVEGCDCEGDAGDVELGRSGDSVLIERVETCYCEEPCGNDEPCSCFCHKKPEPTLTLPEEKTR